jgi:hypothetical protein
VGSLAAFLVLFAIVWAIKAHREPGFARWTLGFPMIVLFLLTSKVYSPQYGLWLLPWFALALPRFRTFAAFEIADVAVFVTRFWFFGDLSGGFGVSQDTFEKAVMLRAAVLLLCLVRWVRLPSAPLAIEERPASVPPVGPEAAPEVQPA